MDTKTHNLLTGDILLTAGSGMEAYKRTFHITKCVSEKGSSAVCYEAYYGDASQKTGSGIGVLKEFYPRAFLDELTRSSDGQLILQHSDSAKGDAFQKEKMKYLQPYERLIALKQRSGNADDIATFIPHFEIYHGCNEAGEPIGTAYVWMPQPLSETFAAMCRDIHEHPTERPEFKLISVLNCIRSLVSCVSILHGVGIIHCDINPNNFGFVKRKDEVLTQSAVLFDTNSICKLLEKQAEVLITEVYSDPWIAVDGFRPQFTWDIYSIGACLFHAIIVCDQTKATDYCYKPEFYDQLKHLVDESELIKVSEYNRHPRLTYYLTRILKRCLNRPDHVLDGTDGGERYQVCEQLLEDLDQALYYVRPSEALKISRDKWQLVDSEKDWDSLKEKNSQFAMQYQLFDHPLYHWGGKLEQTNVMVLGFGNYGQKFTDICLQVGQIDKKPLHISVFSHDIGDGQGARKGSHVSDAEIYLEARPALKQFFQIDGVYDKSQGECYGQLSFRKVELSVNGMSPTVGGLDDCFNGSVPKPQYIFIALGDDATNRLVAIACREKTDSAGIPCCICYACEGQAEDEPSLKDVYPIRVSTTAEERLSYGEIERMAFNAHLVWETNQNLSFEKIRKDYSDPYNHDSNIAYVLNLKYFLHHAGIELPTMKELTMDKCIEIAKTVKETIEDKKVKRMLAYCENKRWNIEKLTQGWQPLDDIESCVYRGTKDKNAKLHACIRRSHPAHTLKTIFKDRSEWDDPKALAHRKLDDIDRLTLMVHQAYLKAAQRVKQENLLSGEAINGIRDLAERQEDVYAAFLAWYSCLTKIWNGDRAHAAQYESLKNAFLNAASVLDDVTSAAIRSQTEAFENVFKPVLASMEYRDEKEKDFLLVDFLPFILTNDPSTCLIVPYDAGAAEGSFDMTKAFANVAVATVVNPEKLVLLISLENERELKLCRQGLSWICSYMNARNLRAEIDVLLTFPREMSPLITGEVTDELKFMSNGRIRKLTAIYRAENLLSAVEGYCEHFGRCLIEKNDADFMGLLDTAKVYETKSYYRCDIDGTDLTFHTLKDCEYLSYIQSVKKAHHHLFIRVTDMQICRKAMRGGTAQPEFYHDYEMLWKKYLANRDEWEYMTSILQDYCRTHDVLAVFHLPSKGQQTSAAQSYLYKIPTYCAASVRLLLKKLKELGIIGKESSMKVDTTRSYELQIFDLLGCRDVYDGLMAGIFRMSPLQALDISLDPANGTVTVSTDNAEVIGLEADERRISDLLNFFRDHGYILCLTRDRGRIGFVFATSQIKALMSDRYRIAEIYIYHKIKACTQFDDVISGREIQWESSGFKRSPGFSYVITQGFRTLFVGFEGLCGGSEAFPLHRKAIKGCGINATAVYIADALDEDAGKGQTGTSIGRREIFSSEIILRKRSEIDKIGETLDRIINGTCRAK